MKDGFIKVAAASPILVLGDVKANCDACISECERAAELGVKLLVFPELTLTGATLGDLFRQQVVLSAAERELERYVERTRHLDVVSFIGLPVGFGGEVYDAVACVHRGELIGIYQKNIIAPDERRWFTPADDENSRAVYAGRETVIGPRVLFSEDGDMPELVIGVCVGAEMYAPISPAQRQALAGATVIVHPSAQPELAGAAERKRGFMISESGRFSAAIVTAEAGIGESGTDGVYSGRRGIYECGDVLTESRAFDTETLTVSEVDVTRATAERHRRASFRGSDEEYLFASFTCETVETELTRYIPASAFIPEEKNERAARCEQLFEIQSRALAERIKRARSKGAVIGVSGGLDSTLALLVAARAVELCGLAPDRLIAVTMPCFGTTARTKGNAERLSEALCADLRCIDIKASVMQHFSDIGHDPENFDVVYENSQARERTQILMDIANAEGALVVGTGDLSELALGFATYNGDHMSMYGVNAGMPKTLMRHMVAHAADGYERDGREDVAASLRDVLATPVSPELLPPKEDGEIAQCTEGIVGPYELHDFFLYYLVRFGFTPAKIARIAKHAFRGVFESDVIEGWLRIFLRRFFTQQFKRSCLPDGPALGSVTLSPRGGFVMPSDVSFAEWLK